MSMKGSQSTPAVLIFTGSICFQSRWLFWVYLKYEIIKVPMAHCLSGVHFHKPKSGNLNRCWPTSPNADGQRAKRSRWTPQKFKHKELSIYHQIFQLCGGTISGQHQPCDASYSVCTRFQFKPEYTPINVLLCGVAATFQQVCRLRPAYRALQLSIGGRAPAWLTWVWLQEATGPSSTGGLQ